jgi:hypothetical protein
MALLPKRRGIEKVIPLEGGFQAWYDRGFPVKGYGIALCERSFYTISNMERIFPDAFLEAGKDDDHSYMSIRTTRQSDGSLKIDVVGWGIAESGLGLSVGRSEDALKLSIFGRCGTVFTETWSRVSLNHVLEKDAEDKAFQIEYSREVSVEAGKIVTQLILYKHPPILHKPLVRSSQ